MKARLRICLAMLGAAAALTACASSGPPAVWSGGDASHLTADKADCHKQADGVDVYRANDYSDPRYGAATAMAAAIDRDDPIRGHNHSAQDAAFQACMVQKGWTSQ
jgi:hypothetical protein